MQSQPGESKTWCNYWTIFRNINRALKKRREKPQAYIFKSKCYIKPLTLESGLNSLFLRILLKISVSSSCRLLSSELDCLERLERMLAEAEAEAGGPVVVAAPSPDAPEESCPGSGASTVGSSTCSISHSMAWVTDMLQENKGKT